MAGAVLQGAVLDAEKAVPLSPEKTLKIRLDAAFEILGEDDLDLEVKAGRIAETVSPLFDFPLMGMLALGPKHWRQFDKQQRSTYIQLFTTHLKNAYRKKLMLYTNEQIVFKSEAIRGGNKAEVVTELVSEENQIKVSYKLRKTSNQWKVYDVVVQGVSLRKSYEAQFHEILSGGTPADVLASLKNQDEDEKDGTE